MGQSIPASPLAKTCQDGNCATNLSSSIYRKTTLVLQITVTANGDPVSALTLDRINHGKVSAVSRHTCDPSGAAHSRNVGEILCAHAVNSVNGSIANCYVCF